MWVTISAEGSDAFEGISRAYAYTFQRPLHYLFYAAVASAFGLVCFAFVYLFTEGVIQMTYWAVSWGANLLDIFSTDSGEPTRIQQIMLAEAYFQPHGDPYVVLDPDGKSQTMPLSLKIGAWLIYAVNGLVRALAVAFTYSFFWCSMSAIYLLLRRDVDQTEFDEVWIEEDEELGTMPAVTTDESGVPQLADEALGNDDVSGKLGPDDSASGPSDPQLRDPPSPP
jgi:hypothetical protein